MDGERRAIPFHFPENESKSLFRSLIGVQAEGAREGDYLPDQELMNFEMENQT